MSIDRYGWRVRIAEDWNRPDEQRVIIAMVGADATEVIVSASATEGAVRLRSAPGTIAAEPVGLLLPRGVVDAIAEMVKPGPAQGEVARLEEALRVERERVDRLLDRLMSREAGDT